jgi:hypothetical protein
LKKQFPEIADQIKPSDETTFMVFEGQTYRQSKQTETMVKNWYFRPSLAHPRGYFVVQIGRVKAAEGELPDVNGKPVFPLAVRRCEYVQTKARGVAMIKPLRPYQAELNRASSKIAETQMTLGDDKLITYGNSKISAGANLSGVRQLTVNGPEPTILPGRSGDQYLGYALECIKEMSQVADLEDEDLPQNLEPHTLLYRAARQKQKFARQVRRFESFLIEVALIGLDMFRLYATDDQIIEAVGRNEAVNVDQFRAKEPLNVRIAAEPQAEDVETKLGRQLTMQSVIQYVGPQLQAQDIGKFIKLMPYANAEEAVSDLTLDYEMATNEILALDRGQEPLIGPADNNEYMLKRLTARQKQADFQFLHPYIQGLYEKTIEFRTQILEQQRQMAARANAGFIPDGGTLIGVDYFVQDPNNPERTRRARIPYAAVDWLVQKLQEQGATLQSMDEMPLDIQANLGAMAPADPMEELAQAEGASGEIVAPQA